MENTGCSNVPRSKPQLYLPDTRSLSLADAAFAWASSIRARYATRPFDQSKRKYSRSWKYADPGKTIQRGASDPGELAQYIRNQEHHPTQFIERLEMEACKDLLIVDIDKREDSECPVLVAKRLKAQFGFGEDVPVVRSPGGGFHLWFALPHALKLNNKVLNQQWPHVDWKTGGTKSDLITLVPSTRQGTRYEWLRYLPHPAPIPQPMLDYLLTMAPKPKEDIPVTTGERPKIRGFNHWARAGLERVIKGIGHDSTCNQLYRASLRCGSLIAATDTQGEALDAHQATIKQALLTRAVEVGLKSELAGDRRKAALMDTISKGMKQGKRKPAEGPRGS